MSLRERKHVIIVGGGLAGIACAVGIAESTLGKVRVTLLESRHALGGRASSFEDTEAPGELLDNCQHVLLGCCTNLLDLYRRLGVKQKITFHRRVHFLDPAGRRHDLWGLRGLPAPLHLSLSMTFFSALTLGERTAAVRAMLAMARLGRAGREKLEATPFGQWLDEQRQSTELVKKFYDPIIISALNEETRKASTKYAIQVFQEAMLANSHGYLIGLPSVPLGELYAKLPQGVDVRLSARVEELLFADNRITGIKLRNEEILTADTVVLATNYHAVQRWMSSLPPETLARDTRFTNLDKLESVPILGAHLWFDRPVMPQKLAAAALIEGPLQWLFRKDTEGRQLHGVISAARKWPAVPKETALRQFETQIRTLFPRAQDAKLLRGVIVIEKRATFAPLPGIDQFRPRQIPPQEGIQNLFLAGDYTQTDWPATMEGAVKSGYFAAEAITLSLGFPVGKTRLLALPLKTQWPARLLGL